MCHIESVPSMNIRELRDSKKLQNWLRSGKTVELRVRKKVVARIVPNGKDETPKKYPDFAARRKRIFGNRVLPAVETLIRERGRY